MQSMAFFTALILRIGHDGKRASFGDLNKKLEF
jgi:hypothetical protein